MITSALVLVACTFAQVDRPPVSTPELAGRVKNLVRELDSNEKSSRDVAEKELVELGPAALEFLPADSGKLSAEAGQRLERVRESLEEQAANAALQATRITLDVTERPFEEVLRALAEQSGNKITDFRKEFGQESTPRMISVKLDGVPFWQALDQVLDDAGLTVYPFASENGIAYVGNNSPKVKRHGIATYAEAFRIEPLRTTAVKNLRDPEQDQLRLDMELSWEPRIEPIVLSLMGASVEASLDDGSKLEPRLAKTEIEIAVIPGVNGVEFPVSFQIPQDGRKAIASLRGEFAVLMPAQPKIFEFAKLNQKKRQELRKGASVVKLEDVRRSGEHWEIRISVTFDSPGRALESHRAWHQHNVAHLVKKGEDPITPGAQESVQRSENEILVKYLFTRPEKIEDYQFVYQTATSIVSQLIPFEIKEIPLP